MVFRSLYLIKTKFFKKMSNSNRMPQEITRTAKIKTSIISAHASTLPNDHDEDRFSLIHDTHSTKQFGFAVFDGHGGSKLLLYYKC